MSLVQRKRTDYPNAGARAVLGSQCARMQGELETDLSVPSDSWPLRAEDGSRSVSFRVWSLVLLWCLGVGGWSFFAPAAAPTPKTLQLSRADYEDRVQAIWTAQIAAVLMGFQFEHKVASTEWVAEYPKKYTSAPVDDDWYYEMCAIRGFEKYGIGMTVEQLGQPQP